MNAARTLVIYHTSDVHGRLGFGAKLARAVEPDALLVDCGDSLRGSSTVFFRSEPVVAEFAAAPYVAQAVGNREFHYIHRCFVARAQAMPMPMVCSNVIDVFGRAPSAFVPDLYVEAAGVVVRFLGLLVPQYRTGSGWERVFGWRFLAPDVALERMLAEQRRGADAIVVLSHLGLRADRDVAARFPGVDAIIGGHTHETLAQAEIVDGTPIAHAGPFARYCGRLALRLGGRKPILDSYELLPLLARGPALDKALQARA